MTAHRRKARKRRSLTWDEKHTIQRALEEYVAHYDEQAKRDHLASLAYDISVGTVIVDVPARIAVERPFDRSPSRRP